MEDACAVCHQQKSLPTKLPNCTHSFCFKCIKGAVSWQDFEFNVNDMYNCPVCRAVFPKNLINTPQQINIRRALPPNFGRNMQNGQFPIAQREKNAKFMWLYESRREGWWWRFDPRDEAEIERHNNMGTSEFEFDVAGHKYTIDLDLNLQIRTADPSNQRKIWRVTSEKFNTLNICGVAGIRNPAVWTIN